MKNVCIFVLVSVCGFGLAGCGKSVDCTSAVVKVFHWPDRRMNGVQMTVTDKATVDALARFFPKMGQGKTTTSFCACISAAVIEFTDSDGTVYTVHIAGLGDHDHYLEDHGQWPLSPEFVGYLTAMLETAGPATQPVIPATQSAVVVAQPAEAPWSEVVNGLRGRVVLYRQRVSSGTAMLGARLELRNDGDVPLTVAWSTERMRHTVADAQGQKLRGGCGPWSGPGGWATAVNIAPGAIGTVEMTIGGGGYSPDMAGYLSLSPGESWEFESADTDYYLASVMNLSQTNDEDAEFTGAFGDDGWGDDEPVAVGDEMDDDEAAEFDDEFDDDWDDEDDQGFDDDMEFAGQVAPLPGYVPWTGRLVLPRVLVPLKPDPLPPNAGELIERLGAEMLENPKKLANPEYYGWVKAEETLSLIDDERVVPWYVKLAATSGNRQAKDTALDRLARFDSDAALEGIKPSVFNETNAAAPSRARIREHGIRCEVDFAGGHKTGYFCDQRENRRRFARFTKGARVLDLCCYTGGFALSAKVAGGADEVDAVEGLAKLVESGFAE